MKPVALLAIAIVAFSLLNSNAFGSDSLIAYFFFSLTACLMGVLFFGRLISGRQTIHPIPAYVWTFLLLAGYVFLNGTINGVIGLRHYYWACLALTLFVVVQMNLKEQISEAARFKTWLLGGVVVLALMECLVIFLQIAGMVGVPNMYFLCTGTWSNPNVTAMFLAMTLYAFQKLAIRKTGIWKKTWVATAAKVLICTAILLLQCRTAVLMSLIILAGEYGRHFINYTKTHIRLSYKGITTAVALLIVVIGLFSFFTSKTSSTYSRLRIWQESMDLILQNPLTGVGFGQFEKQFNLFSASLNLPVNDHVNMAYNDFIEMAVEGGFAGLTIWLCFYILLFRYLILSKRGGNAEICMVVAFLLAQLINFSIQAIPVMLLFVLYIGILPSAASLPGYDKRIAAALSIPGRSILRRIFSFTGLCFSLLLLVKMYDLTNAFYRQWRIADAKQIRKSIILYKQLKPRLEGYASYHEGLGTSYLRLQQYNDALWQFKNAMRVSSHPDLLIQYGFCHQQLGHLDSSEYYYRMVQQMQPHRFSPRLMLLKLYEQQKDRNKAIALAQSIVQNPVKIRSAKVYQIKGYARHVLDSIQKLSPLSFNHPSK